MERYAVLREIGKGAFGRAILCRDIHKNIQVIMKQINLELQSESLQSRSLQEVKVLQSLKHPNVISYIDSFMNGSILCIVMEYAVGGDLWQRISRAHTNFPESLVIQWLSELCNGLQHIHNHHILHRDLKSQNIFLDNSDHVKIGDFGIAKTLEHSNDFAHTIVGSPFYLSPEICMGVPYNAATDVWSLGCVLYEICTLSPAFSGSNMGAIVMKIMQEKQPPIPKLYSRGLADLVDAMLNKSAKWRPSLTDILNFPLLKGDLRAPPSVRRKIGKKRVIEKRAESALQIVPLSIEPPSVARKKPTQVRNSCTRKRGAQPSQPRLKDGATISKFLMVRPLESRLSAEKPAKIKQQVSDLERVIQFDPIEVRACREARHNVGDLREYLNATMGAKKVENACRALRNDDTTEEDVLEQVGGLGNERFVVLVRRLVLAEDELDRSS
jgi:NIMA (never in mitosis gene a)-related kinase